MARRHRNGKTARHCTIDCHLGLALLLREIETKLLSLSPLPSMCNVAKQTTPFWLTMSARGQQAASSIIIARVAIVIDVVAVALLLLLQLFFLLLLPLSCRIVTLNSLVLSVDKN